MLLNPVLTVPHVPLPSFVPTTVDPVPHVEELIQLVDGWLAQFFGVVIHALSVPIQVQFVPVMNVPRDPLAWKNFTFAPNAPGF